MKHMGQCLFILAQNPIAILAHYGQTIENHSLPAGQKRPGPAGVELPREAQVDIQIGGHDLEVIDWNITISNRFFQRSEIFPSRI